MMRNLTKNFEEIPFNLYLDELTHKILSYYEGNRELPFSRCWSRQI